MYLSPYLLHGLSEDYLTCDIAFNAVMPLSRASTRGRYSRIEGVIVNPSLKLWIRANDFHPRPRYITPGARDSTRTRVPLIPQPLMRRFSISGCSTSNTLANGAGRRRRR